MRKIRKTTGLLTLILLLIFTALILYSIIVEPQWFDVTRQNVGMDNFPRDREFTIVQLADFHRGIYIKEDHIRRACEIAAGLYPDIIVLTGDYVSVNPDTVPSFGRALRPLESGPDVYAVLGNHDYWSDAEAVEHELEDAGIKLLTNRNVNLFENVWLIGIDDIWAGKPDVDKAFAGVPGDAAKIVITHSPKIFSRVRDRDCLVLTSHTHAGQVDIPGIPRNRLPGLLGWKYIRGWYYEGNSMMYVNRGIGMVTPPVRFRCRPEISLFRLHPTGG